MTSDGVITTLFDFSAEPTDISPASTLILGLDDNLYGTTSGGNVGGKGGGSVFRLIFPGAPSIYPLNDAQSQIGGVAVVQCKANARGSNSVIAVE